MTTRALALIWLGALACGGDAASDTSGADPETSPPGDTVEPETSPPEECVEGQCASDARTCCEGFMKVYTLSHRCTWCCRAFGSSCADAGEGDGWERGAAAICCWSSGDSHDFGFCGPDAKCCLDSGQLGCHLVSNSEESCSAGFCCSGQWDEATRLCL